MRNYFWMIFGFLTLFSGFGNTAFALEPGSSSLAAQPSLTQGILMPQTALQPAASYKVAGVYWLPDYLKKNVGRSTECEGDNCINGGGDADYVCSSYGFKPSCPAPKVYDRIRRPVPQLTCYQNCHCPSDKFPWDNSSCNSSDGQQTAGASCKDEGKDTVYAQCECMKEQAPRTGEKCDLFCKSNKSRCVKKSCKPAVGALESGEECKERCDSNSSICTKKGCRATVSVGAGETCDIYCGGNCVQKSCKPSVSVGEGEKCDVYCGGSCVKKSCKSAVSVGNGYQCRAYCGGNCVETECKSTSGYYSCECGGSGGSVYSCGRTYYRSCNNCDPCPGYYDCGGEWQYCTGRTCSADSSRCSTYCPSDYFPNACDSAANCNGIYRNGYCSGSCQAAAPDPCDSVVSCAYGCATSNSCGCTSCAGAPSNPCDSVVNCGDKGCAASNSCGCTACKEWTQKQVPESGSSCVIQTNSRSICYGKYQRVWKVTFYCLNGSTQNKVFTGSKCYGKSPYRCYNTEQACIAAGETWDPYIDGTCQGPYTTEDGCTSACEGNCKT